MDEDCIDDPALNAHEYYKGIADDMYNVDYHGVIVQGILSFLAASVASVSTYLVTNTGVWVALLVFMATFVPNISIKVLAEYLKKRALVQGLREGYREGREDIHLLNTGAFFSYLRWYRLLNSASFIR